MNKLCLPAIITAFALVAAVSCIKEKEIVNPESTRLETPKAVFISAGATSATIAWNKIKHSLAYEIYIDTNLEPEIAIDTATTLTGLEPSSRHTLRVRAIPSKQSIYTASDLSEAVTFTTTAKPTLKAPSIKIDSLSKTSFTASWAPVDSAETYKYCFDQGDTLSISDTLVTFDELQPGNTYSLKVQAVPNEEILKTIDPSPWSTINVKTGERDTLNTPVLTVEKATVTRCIISWSAVPNAGSYEYSFDGAETQSTTELHCYFDGLEAESEHSIKLRAIPAEPGLYVESKWDSTSFIVQDLPMLPTPVLKVERASSIHSVISWTAVEGSGSYEYSLDDTDTLTTDRLSVSFDNLPENSEHDLKVRALEAVPGTYNPSEWATVHFKAIYDFESTLEISNASASDLSVDFTASVSTSGEEFFAIGAVPKTDWVKSDDFSQIDSTALVTAVKKDVDAKAKELVDAGICSTMEEAYKSLLNSSTTMFSKTEDVYYELTYLCYAFSIKVSDGSLIDNLQLAEVKTPTPSCEQKDGRTITSDSLKVSVNIAGYNSDGTGANKELIRRYFTNTQTGTVVFKEIKYSVFKSNSSLLTGNDEEVKSKLRNHFSTSGTTMEASVLQKVNDGSTMILSTSLSYSTKYSLAVQAITENDDTVIVVTSFQTYNDPAKDWVDLSVLNDEATSSQIQVKTKASVNEKSNESKFTLPTLNSCTTREEIIDYFKTKGTVISETRLKNLNEGTGFKVNYSPTKDTQYNYIITLVNRAGDQIYRNIIFKAK